MLPEKDDDPIFIVQPTGDVFCTPWPDIDIVFHKSTIGALLNNLAEVLSENSHTLTKNQLLQLWQDISEPYEDIKAIIYRTFRNESSAERSPKMAKVVQISGVSGTEKSPPVLFALREDGSIWVYKPEVYVSHGHQRTVIDNGGWAPIPKIPK